MAHLKHFLCSSKNLGLYKSCLKKGVFLEILFYSYLAIFGLIFGSFIDCAVSRGSISLGRSKCDDCGHVLSARDLIPVFSFLINRGKCRFCGAKIPNECLFAEVFSAIIFVLLGIKFFISIELLMWLILACFLLALSLIDFKTFILPDKLILAIILNRIIFAFILKSSPLSMLIGALSVSLPVLLISLLMEHILKKETMGGGDIKLLFAIGMYFPWYNMIFLIFLACLTALIYILITKNMKIAFGPFISLSCILTALFGDIFINFYLQLII